LSRPHRCFIFLYLYNGWSIVDTDPSHYLTGQILSYSNFHLRKRAIYEMKINLIYTEKSHQNWHLIHSLYITYRLQNFVVN
jgi:hypothetical protein